MSLRALVSLLALTGFTTTYAVPTAPLTCPNFKPAVPLPDKPKEIIIDSDFLSYTDDAGAFAIANTLQTMGYTKILGIVSSVTSKYSLPGMDAINTWYCHPDIPLSQTPHVTDIVREPGVTLDNPEYITKLANPQDFPEDFNRKNVKDPVTFYKDTLSAAEDQSVTIIAIGFLTNLHDLYYSDGGAELIQKKVKELVVQGGSCNTTDMPFGAGVNLVQDLPSAQVVTKWPTPVTFFPGFIAQQVRAGQVALDLSPSSPLRYIYETANFSFKFQPHDILTTFYAIFGLEEGSFKYGNANNTGSLQFVPDPKSAVEVRTDTVWNYAISPPASRHYLLLNESAQTIGNKLNGLLSCYGTGKPVCR